MHSSPQFPGQEGAQEGVQDRAVFLAARTQLTAHIARGWVRNVVCPCAPEGRDRGTCVPIGGPSSCHGGNGTQIPVWASWPLALASPPLLPGSLDANSPAIALLLKSEPLLLLS